MTKQGFIDGLRGSLSGRISPRKVEEHAHYYENYINTQIRMGKEERAVLEELGDPRWIAKTIISANGGEDTFNGSSNAYGDRSSSYGGQRYGNQHYGNGAYGQGGSNYRAYGDGDYVSPSNQGVLDKVRNWFERWSPRIVRIAITVVVFSCIISVVFSLIGALAPIALPILFICFIVKLFKDWLN